MSEIKDLARVTMAAKLIADAARDQGSPAREELAAVMAFDGLERARVLGDDGTDFGTVVLAAGRRTAKVTDPAVFLAWVTARYPDEIVQTVRAAFQERLLAAATKAGDPVDVSTGELIPGVELTQGEPYLTTRPTAEAKDRMRAALSANGLLALVSGGER